MVLVHLVIIVAFRIRFHRKNAGTAWRCVCLGLQLMSVKTYAVVKNGHVENIILVDEVNLPDIEVSVLVPISQGIEMVC